MPSTICDPHSIRLSVAAPCWRVSRRRRRISLMGRISRVSKPLWLLNAEKFPKASGRRSPHCSHTTEGAVIFTASSHDLNLVDKHSDLLALGMTVTRAEVRQGYGFQGFRPEGELWRRREDQFERLTQIPPVVAMNQLHHQFKITFTVTFRDAEIMQHEPAAHVLDSLVEHVVQAIDIIEKASAHASSS